jgi:hypothetical protein
MASGIKGKREAKRRIWRRDKELDVLGKENDYL